MSHNNAHKQGYKQTPLGWIPEEWKIKEFESIATIIMGQSPEGKTYNQTGEGVALINGPTEFQERFPIKKQWTTSPTKICKSGDILLCVRGSSTGRINISNDEFCIGRGVAAIRSNETNNHVFIESVLSNVVNKILRLTTGSTFPNIDSSSLKSIKVLIPPLPEQKKIATILSTWDDAITKTQQLIAQLQLRNKGLMQELLTGKKRLKGFENLDLNYRMIKSFSREISLKNKNDSELIVLSCTKYNGLVPSLEYFGRKIYSDDLTTYKIVPQNCFAYATNHIEEGSIGYQLKFKEALISPMYTVFKTEKSVDDSFLFKVLKSHNSIHQYQKRMEGSIDRRGGLRWDEFSKIKVYLPSIEEQKAISDLLDRAVLEVNKFEQKLVALQLQKKGLMQKLLTGEVRVKI